MMCRELVRLKLPLKKSIHASQRDTPEVQQQRADFKRTGFKLL